MLSFAASPLPAGTYDLVIVGQSSAGVVYSPTVVTGVAPGETPSTVVSLHALPGVSAAPAVLHGMLDVAERGDSSCRNRCRRPTERAGGGVEYADGDRASRPGPLGIELSLATSSGADCSAGTSCVSYDLKTSAGPAFVKEFRGHHHADPEHASGVVYRRRDRGGAGFGRHAGLLAERAEVRRAGSRDDGFSADAGIRRLPVSTRLCRFPRVADSPVLESRSSMGFGKGRAYSLARIRRHSAALSGLSHAA